MNETTTLFITVVVVLIILVGHSMQDIPREDFSILNGCDAAGHSTDKDRYPAFIYKIQNSSSLSPPVTHLPKENNEIKELTSNVSVKLEDISTIELFPSNSSSWQHYQSTDLCDHRSFLGSRHARELNGTKLLLQGSDDPLISHGANSVPCHDDEYPTDFPRSLIAPANNNFQQTTNKRENQTELPKLSQPQENCHRVVKSGCSNLTRQQLKVKANLMSARNQQHQQSQNTNTGINTPPASSKPNQKNQRSQKPRNKKTATVKLRFHHQALPPEYLSHYEATQGQQAINRSSTNYKASNQRSTAKTSNSCQKQSQSRSSHENVRSWLQKIAEIQRTANASKEGAAIHAQKTIEKDRCQNTTVRACESQDTLNRLPTDDNNYKVQKRLETQNTNTLKQSCAADDHFLSSMNAKSSHYQQTNYSDLPFMGEITLDNCKPRRGRKPKKADICHLIHKHYGNILPKKTKAESCRTLSTKHQCSKKDTSEQPLNLCLRDQPNDSYSISSGDELSETTSSCPTPVGTAFDYVRDSMLASNLNKSLSSINEQHDCLKGSNTSHHLLPANEEHEVYPINKCYKKLLESEANGRYKTIKKDNEVGLRIPLSSDFFPSQTLPSPVDLNLDNVDIAPKLSAIQSEAPAANINPNPQLVVPQKRKRSAIFIPPLNIENSKNPATEVSICKFKFTGGSKPSLQEKKMVSVDAGGNYRYFSGTGDKASRGYEYFPRESLQHTAGLLPGVNCTGQKLCLDMPPSLNNLDNDLPSNSKASTSSALHSVRSFNGNTDSVATNTPAAHIEVSKNKACSLTIRKHSSFSSSSPTTLASHLCMEQHKNNSISQQEKKLSKKEKLLKNFKAQGLLIQTQQLESAEGTTYCKFRQLKKLTRYLFRNWKDFLPKNNSNIAEFTDAPEPPTN